MGKAYNIFRPHWPCGVYTSRHIEEARSLPPGNSCGEDQAQRKDDSPDKKGQSREGDPISLARLTAVTGAKQTPSLIALCHPLRIETTETKAELAKDGVEVSVTVAAHEKTGVEMEALTAVAVALLNIWDVVKPYEKDSNGQYPDTRIEFIRVERKVKKPVETP